MELLLHRRRLIGLRLGPLLPDTHQSGLTPRVSKLPIRALISLAHLAPLHLSDRLLKPNILDRHAMAQFP